MGCLLRVMLAFSASCLLFMLFLLSDREVQREEEPTFIKVSSVALPKPKEKPQQERQTTQSNSSSVLYDLSPAIAATGIAVVNPDLTCKAIGAVQSLQAANSAPVYASNEVDEAAQVLHQVAPEYPRVARKQKIEGVVTVQFIISAAGTIHSLQVLSSPSDLLSRAVREAVEQWHFKPAQIEGERVRQRAKISLNFNLKEG